MLCRPWTLLAALPVLVSGIEFTSPKAGATMTVGTQSVSFTVEWKDGGDGPAIADLKSYELTLWAGGNDISGMVSNPLSPNPPIPIFFG